MLKKAIAIILILIHFIASVTIAEDYSIYSTEQLETMKTQIETELAQRSNTQSSKAVIPIFENSYIAIELLSWEINNDQLHVIISVTNLGRQHCTIMTNITKKMMEEDEAFKTFSRVIEISAGTSAYFCSPGGTVDCDFTWDVGEIYDRSLFELIIPNDKMQQIKIARDLPSGNHIGIACLIAPNQMDFNSLIFDKNTDDITEFLNIQIIGTAGLQ